MKLTEAENIEKNGNYCGHCNRNTLLPHEYDFNCIVCGYNVIRRKHELSINSTKKNEFYH